MHPVDLQQGSPAWHLWRSGGIGGSDAPVILGLSRDKTPRALWQEKRGATEYRDDNIALARGRALEPVARDAYCARVGYPAPALCCAHEKLPYLRASLDGWNDERALPVEIKAPRQADHRAARGGGVPRAYLAQCLHILLVTGAQRMHYVSYQPHGFPQGEALAVVEVVADPRALEDLLAAERAFWSCVQTGSPPTALPVVDLHRVRGVALAG